MKGPLALLAAIALASALAAGGSPAARAEGAHRRPADRARAALPILGTRLSEYPAGDGKAIADAACLQCHSADIPRQQRLNEKQWTASVEKMIRWGAAVKETDKAALVEYLSREFGPSNTGFVPTDAAPLAAPVSSH